MKRICTMPQDINTCPYYISNASEGSCNNPNDNCGMLKLESEKNNSEPYKRTKRWYEKYYKK